MYDVAIIGAGTSGYSAAMYAGRFNLKTLILGEEPGGLITTTNEVENWPGIKSISGQDLAKALREHAEVYDVDIKQERVTSIEKTDSGFKLITGAGEYEAKTVILATGTKVRKLGAPGEKELENRGVSYCALCDGAFFKDKVVAVVGGGDGAAVDSLILTQFAKKVYVIVRKDFMRAEPKNQEKLKQNEKIEFIFNTNIKEFIGDNVLQKLKLDNPYNGSDELEVQGCFVAIGHIVNSGLAEQMGVELDERKQIKIDRDGKTNIKGVFACGDVVDSHFKQAITGAGEAVAAAHSAYMYLHHE